MDYEITPVDKENLDGEFGASAIPMEVTGHSDKAKAALRYMEGALAFFKYQGRIIATDESGYLTNHGTGSPEAPFGGPMAEFNSEEEVETWLGLVADDLGDWWNY